MPRPLSRFVAIALFYYFWQCLRQLPKYMTRRGGEGLIKVYFFFPLKNENTFLAPLNTDQPNKT